MKHKPKARTLLAQLLITKDAQAVCRKDDLAINGDLANVSDLKVDFARGTVPTPYGNIAVDWKKDGGIFTMDVSIPSTDICAEVILPDGRAEMLTGKANFECKI